eukprot:3932426-Rhodomonas_salina.2
MRFFVLIPPLTTLKSLLPLTDSSPPHHPSSPLRPPSSRCRSVSSWRVAGEREGGSEREREGREGWS